MTTFDRLDWHLDAAVGRGRPPENAFAHIGLFLAWLIRHDLYNPGAFSADTVAAVKAGQRMGSDLRDDVGDALTSDLLSADGAAFTDAYYPQYLDDYAVAFADVADYAVSDDAAGYARIAPTIDRRYAEWLATGTVGASLPAAEPSGGLSLSGADVAAMSPDELDDMARDLADAIAGSDDAADEFGEATGEEASHDTDGNGNPHDAPDLEALLPREVGGTPLQITSTGVSDWQSSLLRQAVERLGVDPAEAFVALALGGTGEETLAITLYAVPGVAQDRLEAEFSRADYLADGQQWERRDIGDKRVWWSSTDDFDTAFYALGGLVVTAGGAPDRVRAALDVLP